MPVDNDGPAINLIRNIATSFTVEAPVFGKGPYVMLPGMTYTWRVRTTSAGTPLDENSPLWGPWSQPATFRTRSASSAGIAAVSPPPGGPNVGVTPVLQWSNSDLGVFYYEVQLSKDPTFNTDPTTATAAVYWVLIHGGATEPLNSYIIPRSAPLEARTTYFWRVRPRIQGDGTPVDWSTIFSFTTQ